MSGVTLHRTESDLGQHHASHTRRRSSSGSIEDRVSGVEGRMEMSHTAFVAHGTRLTSLETTVASQTAKIANLEASVSTLQASVEASSTALARSQEAIKGIGERLEDTHKATEDLKEKVRKMQKAKSRCCSFGAGG